MYQRQKYFESEYLRKLMLSGSLYVLCINNTLDI
jgi:hypothetical protein